MTGTMHGVLIYRLQDALAKRNHMIDYVALSCALEDALMGANDDIPLGATVEFPTGATYQKVWDKGVSA